PLAGWWRGLCLVGRTWLAHPALGPAVAIPQLAVPPGRLPAVALGLLEQAGVHPFARLEPPLGRGRLGRIGQGCRWLAVRGADGPGPRGQGGEPGAEDRADPKAGDRLVHPTPSLETGRAKRPGWGSFHLLKNRHPGGLIFNEN